MVLKMMKQGKDINDILNMPFNFVFELLSEQHRPKEETSLIAAFGG
ncbi:phage tail assembly chaperone GT [Piscibacillus sp. B03]